MARIEKKAQGFTLIELLVVVVVIATLMGLVFRLAGVGGDQKKRNTTITRLQKLEFALSGYYAAFGSYPPVPLHGSRDIFCDVNDYGVQLLEGGSTTSKLEWPRVRAACLSQPVAVEFPYNSEDKFRKDMMSAHANRLSLGSSVDLIESASIFPSRKQMEKIGSASVQASMWQKAQVFKFGVLSFLLPRYLFMVAGPEELYDKENYSAPWQSQNDLKTLFRFSDGKALYTTERGWKQLQKDTRQRESSDNSSWDPTESADYKKILMQPSQAVCARWMEALDGIIDGGETFFGVNTRTGHNDGNDYMDNIDPSGINATQYLPYYVASQNGPQTGSGSGNKYVLNGMSIRDGWGEEIFFYSPPPYQSYRVWSAGPNKRTIPPWVELEDLANKSGEAGDGNGAMGTAARWISDDVVGLSTPAD